MLSRLTIRIAKKEIDFKSFWRKKILEYPIYFALLNGVNHDFANGIHEMNESHNYDLCKTQFDFNITIFFF